MIYIKYIYIYTTYKIYVFMYNVDDIYNTSIKILMIITLLAVYCKL